MTPNLARAYWLGFLGCAVSATGLVWSAVGSGTGHWLILAGTALTLVAAVIGLWGIGWRGLAVASAIFLGVGTAGLAIVTVASCAPEAHQATLPTCAPVEPTDSQP